MPRWNTEAQIKADEKRIKNSGKLSVRGHCFKCDKLVTTICYTCLQHVCDNCHLTI